MEAAKKGPLLKRAPRTCTHTQREKNTPWEGQCLENMRCSYFFAFFRFHFPSKRLSVHFTFSHKGHLSHEWILVACSVHVYVILAINVADTCPASVCRRLFQFSCQSVKQLSTSSILRLHISFVPYIES